MSCWLIVHLTCFWRLCNRKKVVLSLTRHIYLKNMPVPDAQPPCGLLSWCRQITLPTCWPKRSWTCWPDWWAAWRPRTRPKLKPAFGSTCSPATKRRRKREFFHLLISPHLNYRSLTPAWPLVWLTGELQVELESPRLQWSTSKRCRYSRTLQTAGSWT